MPAEFTPVFDAIVNWIFFISKSSNSIFVCITASDLYVQVSLNCFTSNTTFDDTFSIFYV